MSGDQKKVWLRFRTFEDYVLVPPSAKLPLITGEAFNLFRNLLPSTAKEADVHLTWFEDNAPGVRTSLEDFLSNGFSLENDTLHVSIRTGQRGRGDTLSIASLEDIINTIPLPPESPLPPAPAHSTIPNDTPTSTSEDAAGLVPSTSTAPEPPRSCTDDETGPESPLQIEDAEDMGPEAFRVLLAGLPIARLVRLLRDIVSPEGCAILDRERIDGRVLVGLSDADMKDIDLPFGDRRRLASLMWVSLGSLPPPARERLDTAPGHHEEREREEKEKEREGEKDKVKEKQNKATGKKDDSSTKADVLVLVKAKSDDRNKESGKDKEKERKEIDKAKEEKEKERKDAEKKDKPEPASPKPSESKEKEKAKEKDAKRPPITMMGFMTKEGGRRKNWKRRFFVLRGDWLAYYKSKPVSPQAWAKATPLGEFSLAGYEVISGHEAERILGRSLAMLLKAPARRTYSFVAPNERERTAWASAFGRLGRGESVEGFGAGHVTLTIEKATASPQEASPEEESGESTSSTEEETSPSSASPATAAAPARAQSPPPPAPERETRPPRGTLLGPRLAVGDPAPVPRPEDPKDEKKGATQQDKVATLLQWGVAELQRQTRYIEYLRDTIEGQADLDTAIEFTLPLNAIRKALEAVPLFSSLPSAARPPEHSDVDRLGRVRAVVAWTCTNILLKLQAVERLLQPSQPVKELITIVKSIKMFQSAFDQISG